MGQRPPHVKPPAHLSKSPPVPEPDSFPADSGGDLLPAGAGGDPLGLDPTRYGDWTLKGIAVDF
jgi:hypothetical protein